MNFHNMVTRINRMYLFLMSELAAKHGVEFSANMLGIDLITMEQISSMDPAEIEELAEVGFPLIRIDVPPDWRNLPVASRKGWLISKAIEARS